MYNEVWQLLTFDKKTPAKKKKGKKALFRTNYFGGLLLRPFPEGLPVVLGLPPLPNFSFTSCRAKNHPSFKFLRSLEQLVFPARSPHIGLFIQRAIICLQTLKASENTHTKLWRLIDEGVRVQAGPCFPF